MSSTSARYKRFARRRTLRMLRAKTYWRKVVERELTTKRREGGQR